MRGILKYKEDKSWVVEYQVWDDERIYQLPVCPETMLLVKCKPDLEVDFKEFVEEDKVCAKLIPNDSKNRVDQLMKNNIKIKSYFGRDCEICGEHIDDWNKPMCVSCLDALKELILERKKSK